MNRVKIVCKNNNLNERLYTFDLLFNCFLGLSYEVEFCEDSDYYCITYKDQVIKFADAFFGKYDKELEYLNKEGIPKTTKLFESFPYELKTQIIYGEDYYHAKNNLIICGLDIFASSFFSLTRWEEFVITTKNKEGRTDEFKLLSVREIFFDRPIVNEYIEILKTVLNEPSVHTWEKSQFKIKITHDVDWVHLSSQKLLISNLVKRVLKKDQTLKSFQILYNYYYHKISNKNPFNCFAELLDLYNKYNLKAAFYFKAVQKGESGFTYDVNDKIVSDLIHKIENANHEIGFHPSENTVFDAEQFVQEKSRLQKVTTSVLSGGRNHGLFYNKDTYRQWEENGFSYDTGMGFQYMNGFRCGICNEFPIFDIHQRKQLKLKQVPFIAMDTVVFRKKSTPSLFLDEIQKLCNIVKKYNGQVNLNWHSNLINSKELKAYKPVFIKTIKYISTLNEMD